jgi:hypothetical protein
MGCDHNHTPRSEPKTVWSAVEELQTIGLLSKIIGSSYEMWFDTMFRYKAFNKKKFNKLCIESNAIDVEIVVTKREAKCTCHWKIK